MPKNTLILVTGVRGNVGSVRRDVVKSTKVKLARVIAKAVKYSIVISIGKLVRKKKSSR